MFPKKIRLKVQRVYTAPRTLLNAAKKVDQKLWRNRPAKIRNSPTKLLVSGKLILASENIRKTLVKSG
jgi:hypothetical protein